MGGLGAILLQYKAFIITILQVIIDKLDCWKIEVDQPPQAAREISIFLLRRIVIVMLSRAEPR